MCGGGGLTNHNICCTYLLYMYRPVEKIPPECYQENQLITFQLTKQTSEC